MMRRMVVVILMAVFLCGAGFAVQESDDSLTTAQDLSQLRKKLSRVKHEMDLLIRDMVSTTAMTGGPAVQDFAGDVNIDILQNEKSVVVKADLPGMEKDKINIALESERFLKISGEREVLKTQNAPGVVRRERFFGSFEKTVELPCEVENFGISATYKDGVLEITIPKKAKAKESKVRINVK